MTYILSVKDADGNWAEVPTIKGTDGVGVPVGGEAGQVLIKAGNADYDTQWANMGQNIRGNVATFVSGVSVYAGRDCVFDYNPITRMFCMRGTLSFATTAGTRNIALLASNNLPVPSKQIDFPGQYSSGGGAVYFASITFNPNGYLQAGLGAGAMNYLSFCLTTYLNPLDWNSVPT